MATDYDDEYLEVDGAASSREARPTLWVPPTPNSAFAAAAAASPVGSNNGGVDRASVSFFLFKKGGGCGSIRMCAKGVSLLKFTV